MSGDYTFFTVSIGTLEVQHVTNKSQRLKVRWVSQKDISIKINVRTKMNKNTPKLENEEVKAMKAKCPDCDAELDVPKDTSQGEILSCPSCGLELEVKTINCGCVALEQFTHEGEDWGE
jgi:alpha-aminoadipate carrier protein LysW